MMFNRESSEESFTPNLSIDSSEYDIKDEGKIKQVPSTRKIRGMSDKEKDHKKKILSFF